MVDQLRDPLTHLIRNAVDHGIEAPEARVAAGKAAEGVVTLSARQGAGTVVVEVRDDGRGLDLDAIAARAAARGLLDQGTRPTDAELGQMIFRPGFSTAAEVTDLSGRGVGMDVVRRTIEGIRGTVTVTSSAGRGTRIVLTLPLTLAIIDGFGVGVGPETYLLPLESVRECFELPGRAGNAGSGVLNVRGQALPFLRLRSMLSVSGDPPPRESVVVIRHGGTEAGVVVDWIDGEQQTVVKPLSGALRAVRGFAGSAILGSGRVALILDLGTLLAESRQRVIAN